MYLISSAFLGQLWTTFLLLILYMPSLCGMIRMNFKPSLGSSPSLSPLLLPSRVCGPWAAALAPVSQEQGGPRVLASLALDPSLA